MVLFLQAVTLISFAFASARAGRPANFNSQPTGQLSLHTEASLERTTVQSLDKSRGQIQGEAFENLRFSFKPKRTSARSRDDEQEPSDDFGSGHLGKNFEPVAGRKASPNLLNHENTKEEEAVYPGFGRPPFESVSPDIRHDHHNPPYKAHDCQHNHLRRPHRIVHRHHRSRCHRKPLGLLLHSISMRNLSLWAVTTSSFILIAISFRRRWVKSREGQIRLEEEEEEVSKESARGEEQSEKHTLKAIGAEVV
ncbi:hypothetical protein JCM5350_001722 [Sporobolomyces pararoseus]